MRRTGAVPGIVVALLALAGAARPARAQTTCTAPLPGSCTVSASASLTIGGVVLLSVTTATSALAAPTEADYDAGFAATTGPVITVMANTPWSLQLASTAAQWSATSTVPGIAAWTAKPASDLLWGTTAAGPWTGASTAGATLASGGRTAGTTIPLFYRTRYGWTTDTPGSYSLTLMVSITAP